MHGIYNFFLYSSKLRWRKWTLPSKGFGRQIFPHSNTRNWGFMNNFIFIFFIKKNVDEWPCGISFQFSTNVTHERIMIPGEKSIGNLALKPLLNLVNLLHIIRKWYKQHRRYVMFATQDRYRTINTSGGPGMHPNYPPFPTLLSIPFPPPYDGYDVAGNSCVISCAIHAHVIRDTNGIWIYPLGLTHPPCISTLPLSIPLPPPLSRSLSF